MQLFGREVTHLILDAGSYAQVRLDDGRVATIPSDHESYPEAQALAQEGPSVPAEVTNAQARVALRAAGLLELVQLAVDNASPEVSDAWEYSPTISRDSTLVTTLATELNLTSDQIDNLFRAAAQIEF